MTRLVLFVAVAASLWHDLPTHSVDAGGAVLTFDPASAEVALAGNASVFIDVDGVSDLGGYDVFIQFDPSIVIVTSLNDVGFVTGGANIVVCNDPVINNIAGTASISCATVPVLGTPMPGVSASSPTAMVNATFTGVSLGTSSLTMTGTALLNPNGNSISASLNGGSIDVTGSPAVGGLSDLPARQEQPSLERMSNRLESPLRQITFGLAAAAAITISGWALWRNRSKRS